MKTKKLVTNVLVLLLCMVAFTACTKKSFYSNDYAMQEITLVDTDTNNSDYMKGFSMQGIAGDLNENKDIFSIAMCYTTGTLEEVKEFFKSSPYNEKESFLAEIDALDLDGRIRNLSEDKKAYFDGNTEDPIRFYADGTDLLHGGSLLQNPGEYHFYLVVIGYEKVLWVGEADKTFTMDQATIDMTNTFNAAFEVITEATLLAEEDASKLTQDTKTAAAQEYYKGLVDALNLGLTTEVVYGEDENYPDDYEVTISKDGVSSTTYVTVYFGK